ncbi:MAG: hypothetical protein O0X93_05055 [Methanocorpusculum sp.]|nr:hypothetical protein [Methanocorpusculum sp.]MDE2522519.1 hypothetical protein [Methanocorpusculum sp.]MDE2523801.1 hypothetical protein [Methanocorpusculum sp.]
MARKKQEFDPLAGPIGGSGLRKKKSKGKSFDVLGGGFGSEHPVEKESFDSYEDISFGNSSDALMETGGSSSSKSQSKKKGLFASIFGGGKKKKQQQPKKENMPLEGEEERPESYVPKHVRDPGLEIQDGVMETGIADRMVDPASEYDEPEYGEQYEEPVPHHPSAGEPEEDLFEEEEIVTPRMRSSVERKTTPASVPVRTVAPPPSPASERASHTPASATAGPDMHVCHLCSAVSQTELPQFGSGSGKYVPLCRTCYRAVTTLIKFRDPEDEREIKSEWYTLCPNLDSDRADAVIAEARKNS